MDDQKITGHSVRLDWFHCGVGSLDKGTLLYILSPPTCRNGYMLSTEYNGCCALVPFTFTLPQLLL